VLSQRLDIVLFQQDGPDELDDGLFVGEDADHVRPPFDLFIQPFQVDTAALPRGPESLGDGGLEAFIGVGDDKLHASKSPTKRGFEKERPERLGFVGADV